jgi:hypothetical protein
MERRSDSGADALFPKSIYPSDTFFFEPRGVALAVMLLSVVLEGLIGSILTPLLRVVYFFERASSLSVSSRRSGKNR